MTCSAESSYSQSRRKKWAALRQQSIACSRSRGLSRRKEAKSQSSKQRGDYNHQNKAASPTKSFICKAAQDPRTS